MAISYNHRQNTSNPTFTRQQNYLMNGTADDVVQDAGLEKELISRFKEVQGLDTEDKKTVLPLMDAIIAKTKIQTLLHAN